MRKLLWLSRVALCLGLGTSLVACAHTKSRTVADLSAESLAWNAKTDNPLMDFVPDDAAFVAVTQRGQFLNNEGMQTFVDVFGNVVGAGRNLSGNYVKSLSRKCGLEPTGKGDAAMYVRDGYGVIHLTVVDAQRATSCANELVEELSDSVADFDCPEDGDGESRCLVESDEGGWHVYHKVANGREAPVKFALHNGGTVYSMIVYDAGRSIPDDILRPAKKPFVPRDAEKNGVFVGRIRYASFFESLARFPAFANEDFLNDVCLQETASFFADFPETEWQVVVTDAGNIGMRLSTSVASDDTVHGMKSVITEHAELNDDDVLLRGFVGVSFLNAWEGFANTVRTVIVNRDLQCRPLRGIQKESEEFITKINKSNGSLIRNRNGSFGIFDIQSLSIVIKNMDKVKRRIFPHGWANIVCDGLCNFFLTSLLDNLNEEFDSEYFHIKTEEKSMFVWTSPYQIEETRHTMVKSKDTFLDLRLRKELLESLGDLENWMVSDYHLSVGIRDKDFVISLIPE